MLSNFSQYVVYDLFKLSRGTQISGALEFFIYDSIKIFMLLAVIIFAISFVRSFFPPEKTRKILSHKKEFIGNILASLLGVVTPFCSCSAVPLFIGFIEGAYLSASHFLSSSLLPWSTRWPLCSSGDSSGGRLRQSISVQVFSLQWSVDMSSEN